MTPDEMENLLLRAVLDDLKGEARTPFRPRCRAGASSERD